MDEIQINGGDSLGDDFYEKIEAPKFVDLTAPDHHRPDNDDRYWFCLRVGCDKKHEEEMDAEAIYNNFVLRVIAARSPNVRLRKTIYGKDPSANVKCPLTVPAKPSKSRVSRLALVSSFSQKMVDGKMKGRSLFKQCETPKKGKQSSVVVAKALTMLQNKKRLSNLGTFRSVRNPKPAALSVSNNKMVPKALVFHSPKKTVRMNLKKSTELSMRKICDGMKKLEITGGKKFCILGSNKPVPVDSSRKRFRGREVKSRVYDSLLPQNRQGMEVKSSKCLKKKNEENELQLHCFRAPCEDTENDSSDMEIEEKSRNGSLENYSTSVTSQSEKGNEHEECLETQKDLKFQLGENKGEAISDTSRIEGTSLVNCKEKKTGDIYVPHTEDQNGESSKTSEGSGISEHVKSSQEKGVVTDENENASVSDDKENEGEIMNNDDKENASASFDNRKLNSNNSHMGKKKIIGKQETNKRSRTVTKGMTKTPKGNSTATVNCADGVSCRKPKLTNPKPFRLRTDERQILKEANLEKKLHLEPLKETTKKRIHHNAVQRNEKCLEQTEYASDTCEASENESGRRTRKNHQQRNGTSCPQTSKAAAERKESTAPQASIREFSEEKVARKSHERLKRTKSLRMKHIARTRGIEPSKKKKTLIPTTPGRLGVIKESSPTTLRTKAISKPIKNGASPATKASASSASRPSFLGRKPLTIPKEPHFHNVHVPKSCTRRAA